MNQRCNYDAALDTMGFSLDSLRAIVMLIRDWHEKTGRWPSEFEVRAMLMRPS